jgi:hypothetical protein
LFQAGGLRRLEIDRYLDTSIPDVAVDKMRRREPAKEGHSDYKEYISPSQGPDLFAALDNLIKI